MFKTIVVLSALISISSFAQTNGGLEIEQDASQLANEIFQNGRYLNTQQRASISDQLRQIRTTLYGSGPVSQGDYTCTSRDNDGRSPWVFGYRVGVTITRMNNSTFSTIEDCQSSLRSVRPLRSFTLACVARDNDGRSPWVLGTFDQASVNKLSKTAMPDLATCQSTVARAVVQLNFAIFCLSRDNDARSPFVAASLDLNNKQIILGNETFSDINQCWQSLGR